MTHTDIARCTCGSGLSSASCCSLADSAGKEQDAQCERRSASGADASAVADQLAAEAQRAAEALRASDRTTAERLSLSVLERAPRLPLALATLAQIHFEANQRSAAKALLERLAKVEPANLWPINKLAMLALSAGDLERAEQHARQAVRLAPTNMQAHNLMGMAMTQGHRPVIGEYHCRKALELAGRPIPLVLSNLATCLKEQGRISEARELYRQAVDLDPNSRATLLAWAQMEEADRQLDAANAVLDRLERLGPLGSAATLVRAAVLSRTKRYQEAMALLDGQARSLRPVEGLERGRLLDQLGRYDEAWSDFSGAKARLIELTEQSYKRQEAQDLAHELKAFFTRERLALLPRAEVREDMAQPVFILGFPRSGTTLLEQTLTAVPEIAAGDELVLVNEIAELAPRLLDSPWDYPGALAELWLGDRREGLNTLRRQTP